MEGAAPVKGHCCVYVCTILVHPACFFHEICALSDRSKDKDMDMKHTSST